MPAAIALARHEATTLKVDEPGPWHAGELALQHHIGALAQMDGVGRRAIRDYLTEQHRLFYAQLPFVVLGSVDQAGNAWATIRAGMPGFLTSPDAFHLNVALPRDTTDPADAGLENGDGVGLLGIELHTRRRNRLNGLIHRSSSNGFSIRAEQSFGNCPRYIHRREFAFVRDPASISNVNPVAMASLNGRAAEMVAAADTFFVASYVTGEDERHHPDISHRGGEKGFVRIDQDGGLTIPDFSGNRFFTTLGNMVVNPKAGLVFADFTTGDLLQMTGDAKVILDSPEQMHFPGAERLWRFRPRHILHRLQALPLQWQDLDGPSQTTSRTAA